MTVQVGLGVVVSLCVAMVGGTIGAVQMFETKADADMARGNLEQSATEKRTAGDVDSQLMTIEAELKLYRSIEERRPLNADEVDRVDFLRELRRILQEQRLPGG